MAKTSGRAKLSNMPSKPKAETPFERFSALTKKIVSVPRAEIQKRETRYKEQRKIKNHHRHP
jgi:hypothetical protein